MSIPYRTFNLVLLSFVLLISACKDEPEPEPIPDFMKCKIQNVEWKASKSLTAEQNTGIIILNGISHSNDTLRLLISDHTPGTWPIKNIQNITILKTEGKTFVPLNSADGFLTIKSHDTVSKIIEGTFYLTVDAGGGDWKEITDGSFKITYF